MSNVKAEIEALEEELRQAELGPDPKFFEDHLAEDAVMVSENGRPGFAKAEVVAAHRPGAAPKFGSVEMSALQIVEHGVAAVVTCQGTYVHSQGTAILKFMRVWLKTGDEWQIIAGSISR